MDASASNKLRINIAATNSTVTIYLSGGFAIQAHREFKAGYNSYLDSSALGMLLVLRELAQAANITLTLSSPSPIAERSFDLASFHKMFVIN